MTDDKGVTFAVWLHRVLTETPELRAARRAADLLAELKAEAAPLVSKHSSDARSEEAA